jgi:hypothetical protein
VRADRHQDQALNLDAILVKAARRAKQGPLRSWLKTLAATGERAASATPGSTPKEKTRDQ